MSNKHIYKNIFMLAVIIFSYIGLILYISNEATVVDSKNLPEHAAIDAEMLHQSMPIQDANFKEIQINKNIINLD